MKKTYNYYILSKFHKKLKQKGFGIKKNATITFFIM